MLILCSFNSFGYQNLMDLREQEPCYDPVHASKYGPDGDSTGAPWHIRAHLGVGNYGWDDGDGEPFPGDF